MEKYVIIIDTETANSVEEPLPYDFGWAVVDIETGEIIEEKSYVVAEIFFDKELMAQAYFAEKIPTYFQEIKKGKRQVASLLTVRKAFHESMKRYKVHEVGAYNMNFDRRAANNDTRYLTKSFIRWFFPYGTELFCIWHMACTSFLNTLDYVNFAVKHGFVSECGNIQTSAECAYRYLTKNPDFEESHTGLEDVKIEIEIMNYCLKTGGKNMKTSCYSACWRIVQKIPH